VEGCRLLGRDAVELGKYLPTFRRHLLFLQHRENLVQDFELNAGHLILLLGFKTSLIAFRIKNDEVKIC
jgi:hypothetical protein